MLKIIATGVFLFYSLQIEAQKNLIVDSILKTEKSSEFKIKLLDSILSHKNNFEIQNLKEAYHGYAYWLYDQKETHKAVKFELKAIKSANTIQKIDTTFLNRSYYALGFYFYQLNRFKECVFANKKIISNSNINRYTAPSYVKIGLSYDHLGDYYNAIKYLELAIPIEKRPIRLREIYQNLAHILTKTDNKQYLLLAEKYARFADSISKVTETEKATHFNIKTIYADLYNNHQTLDINRADILYNEALQIAKESGNQMLVRDAYISLGNLYNQIDNKLSDDYLKKALQLSQPTDTIRIYQIYIDFGFNLALQEKFKESVSNYEKGITYLLNRDLKNVTPQDASHLDPNIQSKLTTSFSQLAEVYLNDYEVSQESVSLTKSLYFFKLADTFIDQLRRDSSNFQSRLFWRKLSAQLYSNAIRACYLIKDNELAFYFMEKNKAILLQEDISKQNLKNDAPQLDEDTDIFEELEKEFLVAEDYTALEKIKLNTTPKTEAKKSLRNITINSISETQKELDNNSLLIEYNLSKDDGYGIYSNTDKGYVLIISKTKTWFYEIEKLENVEQLTRTYLDYCKKPFKSKEDQEKFTKISNNLFTTIFPSETIRNEIKQKSLTIIPDSFLSFLPFETLVTKPNHLKYLIQESKINYQYSYSFLKNSKQENKVATNFIAFAPYTFDSLGLSPLHFGKSEVQALEQNYPGTVFYDKSATKEAYINAEQNNDIIHFTTHANAQDSISPWIAFTDKKLSLDELYNTKNNASLVFLSGCNTTLGKQETGEGVMSLARGFFQGGASSVISSLWNVDDKATATISKDFYEQLASGKTKSAALHTAKLNYLNTHSHSEKSPYFWASLILLGQDDTLLPASANWPYYVIAIGLLFGLLFFFYLKKIKNKG